MKKFFIVLFVLSTCISTSVVGQTYGHSDSAINATVTSTKQDINNIALQKYLDDYCSHTLFLVNDHKLDRLNLNCLSVLDLYKDDEVELIQNAAEVKKMTVDPLIIRIFKIKTKGEYAASCVIPASLLHRSRITGALILH